MSYYQSTTFYNQGRARQRQRARGAEGLQVGFDFMPPASTAEAVYRATRDFPTTPEALLKKAHATLKAYDEAIRAGEEEKAEAAITLLQFIGDKMPEDDPPDDIDEDEEWDPNPLKRLLAAKPGEIPMWGQTGKFLVSFQGVRVVVYKDGLSTFYIEPLDFDRPFFNKFGHREYRHSSDDARGRNVKQVVLLKLKEGQIDFNGRKRKLETLQARLDWVYNEETEQDEKVIIVPGPNQDDPDWQPGGWLYKLTNG